MSARYTVLTGGVGGAKLVNGLYRILPPHSLTAIVNTGDDFRHYGLPVSPDIDTLLYTLSGRSNQTLGWGREGETWNFMAALTSLGGENWFNLGDGDLALHVLRGHALASGETLTSIIASFAAAWNLALTILPMTDDAVATFVDTDDCKVKIANSLISGGCFIQGSQIQRSILGFRCNIGPCSHISESVLLGDVKIGEGCSIRRAIIDKNVEIAPGTVIGENLDHDRERFTVSEGGIVVVPKGARVGY